MKRRFTQGKRAKQMMRRQTQLNEESANFRRVDEILRRMAAEGKGARHG